jgi:hypothetical protein
MLDYGFIRLTADGTEIARNCSNDNHVIKFNDYHR